MPKRSWFLLILLLAAVAAVSAGAAPVTVAVASAPAGAQILLDGEDTGLKTPARLAIAEPAAIGLRKQGYKDYEIAIDPAKGASQVFARLSPAGSLLSFVRQFKTGNRPKDLIFSPDGRYLVITLLGDRGIQLYDMDTGALKKIDLSAHTKTPSFVEGVFTPDGREFWFNQMSERGVTYVLDMSALRITKVIPTGGRWSKVGEFSPDGAHYYVTNWLSNDVSVMSAADYRLLRLVKTPGKAPRGLGFSDDGRFLYVVFYDSGEIMKFAVDQDYKLITRIKNGGTNGRFRIDRARGIAYVNNMLLRKVFLYSLAEDRIAGEFKTWINPNNVQIAPGGRYIYVSNRGPNSKQGYLYRSPVDGRIQIFDAEAGYALVEEIQVGNQPIGIAFTGDGRTVAFSNYMDNTVDLYTVETGQT